MAEAARKNRFDTSSTGGYLFAACLPEITSGASCPWASLVGTAGSSTESCSVPTGLRPRRSRQPRTSSGRPECCGHRSM
eukprot:7777455-Alexandrium_andersonii.AAC.1